MNLRRTLSYLGPALVVFSASRAWGAQPDPKPPTPTPSPQEVPYPTKLNQEARRRETLEEDFGLNLGPLFFKDFTIHGEDFAFSHLAWNPARARSAQENGPFPPFVVTLQYDDLSYHAQGGGFTLDAGALQFSVDYFKGRLHGDGILTLDNGITAPTSTPLSLRGDIEGIRGGVYWPALYMKGGPLRMTLGPDFTVAWHHELLDPIPQSPLWIDRNTNEMIGSIGPRFRIELQAGQAFFTAEGEWTYLVGSTRGWGREYSVGIGIRF